MSKRRKLAQGSVFSHIPADLRATLRAQAFPEPQPAAAEERAQPAEVVRDDAASTQRRNTRHSWDCTGLVTRYTSLEDVPLELRKYWYQRQQLFSKYDEANILMDETGWFSVTPEDIARHTAERCRSDTLLDGFCGVGGNAIQFAFTCERVIAIDNDMTRLRLARHNAMQYGVADRIEFVCADVVDFLRTQSARAERGADPAIDSIFLSPPWGGVNYLHPANGDSAGPAPSYSLQLLKPLDGQTLISTCRKIAPLTAVFLPRNIDVEEISRITTESDAVGARSSSTVAEIEEVWTGRADSLRVKACTVYFD